MAVTLHPPAPVTLRRRRSASGTVVEALLALTIATATVSTLASAFTGGDHGAASAATSATPTLDPRDRAALGLGDDVHDYFGAGAAPALVARLEQQVAADGARLTQVRLYPDRAFATARAAGDVTVDYAWTAGSVAPGASRSAGDPTGALLAFDAADVAWDRIAGLVAEAPRLVGLDAGTVTHVTVDRSTLDPSLPITIRIHVSGDRAGHPTNRLVEVAADGRVMHVA
jgi:hypothetical protein